MRVCRACPERLTDRFVMPSNRSRKSRRRGWKWILRHPWKTLLLLVVVGAAGWYFFTGWRARDLASKARESFEKGNYRMAWLQLQSARDLRASDPEVLRTGALLEAKFGRPEALDTLQERHQGRGSAPT